MIFSSANVIFYNYTGRITEWFGFEGTLEIISFQPSAMGWDPSN